MKVVYTGKSLDSLEEILQFLLHQQKIPLEKVLAIKTRLLDRADSLVSFPEEGQIEKYLEHLGKIIEELWKDNLRLYIGWKENLFISQISLTPVRILIK